MQSLAGRAAIFNLLPYFENFNKLSTPKVYFYDTSFSFVGNQIKRGV